MKQYRTLFDIVSTYWASYGGWVAVFYSPFFHLALLVTLITNNLWLESDWGSLALSIMPSLLGFTLGGYALLVTISDKEFFDILIDNQNQSEKPSPFLELNSSFVHFIILQIVSIILAVLHQGNAIPDIVIENKFALNVLLHLYHYLALFFDFLGFLVFSYALSTSFAIVLAIFDLAGAYEDHRKNNQD